MRDGWKSVFASPDRSPFRRNEPARTYQVIPDVAQAEPTISLHSTSMTSFKHQTGQNFIRICDMRRIRRHVEYTGEARGAYV